MPLEAFFFSGSQDLQLFGVWRGPREARRVWVLCPPFAEEEKSARRVLTQIAQLLESQGEASLLFSFRGTGDSQGDFAMASLEIWRQDIAAAIQEAKKRAPAAEMALLGIRLGASLALQECSVFQIKTLILIEPLLSGRSFLVQQIARKQIRAQLTGTAFPNALPAAETEDLDGWALSKTMKTELNALDLRRQTPAAAAQTQIFQVGPRAEIAPPLQAFALSLKAHTQAVVMPPFWNLIDTPDASPLLYSLSQCGIWKKDDD